MKIYILANVLLVFLYVNTLSAARDDLNSSELEKVRKAIALTTSFDKAERSEALTGGAGTVNRVGKNAFSHHLTNLSFEDRQNFLIGNGFFRKLWVAAPSSTVSSDGLGPLYNARACQSCHIKDGKGHLPLKEKPLSLVIKTGKYENLNLIPDSIYGKQFQFFAIPGLEAEVFGNIIKQKINKKILEYNDYQFNKIKFKVSKYSYGHFSNDNTLSMRISPQVYGTGLLEAIVESDILEKHDPNDLNKDGISGIGRMVLDENGERKVGRFGLRASTPNLFVQSGVAFTNDMGISNLIAQKAYGDCTNNQADCFKFPTGIGEKEQNETSKEVLDSIVFYLSSLSPPKRRNVNDKEVLEGKKIFYEAKCTSCHTPKYVTSKNAKFDFLKFQLIWPYTDLLLHDMGEGLADKDLNGNISNLEWKTPPLWGIGLQKEVNPRTTFLHDGRAETILDAILLHGGEAKKSIEYLIENHSNNLDKLVKFVESL